jgi:uroporphyrinogen-III synthase
MQMQQQCLECGSANVELFGYRNPDGGDMQFFCAEHRRAQSYADARLPAPAVKEPDRDALEIGIHFKQASLSITNSVLHLLEAGRRLAQKKAGLKHGGWLRWLDANADVLGFTSPSTAQRLMRAAEQCGASAAFAPPRGTANLPPDLGP